MPIASVIFDLDGTLWASEAQSGEALLKALEDFGVVGDEEDRAVVVGRSWLEIHRRVCERYQLNASLAAILERVDTHRVELMERDGPCLLPGAREAVLRVARDVPVGLVTGSSRREMGHALRALGLDGVFGVALAAEDVPTSKPEPDGYLMAARALGAMPQHCVVVEDSEPGILAGKRAGMWVVAVAVGASPGHSQEQAHLRIATLNSLHLEEIGRAMVPAL